MFEENDKYRCKLLCLQSKPQVLVLNSFLRHCLLFFQL